MNQRKWSRGTIPAYATVLTAVTVQLCATIMLHYGYTTEQSISLTNLGKWLCRPEREIPLFVMGCATALFMGLIANRGIPSFLARKAFTPDEHESLSRTLFFLSIGSFVLYIPLAYDQLIQLTSSSPHHAYDLVPYLLPAVLLLGLSTVEVLIGPSARSRASSVVHGVLPFLFIVLLLPKDWHALSGYYFFNDDMLHHMNFFVVTPYVNVMHGKVLALEAYSQYGLGWPTLFSYLFSIESASYALFFLSFILITIVYLGTFYGLLRLVTGNYVLALTGLLLWYALVSMKHGHPFWGGPQALPARYPFDAVIMISAYAFLRSGRHHYSLIISCLLGMALFWITDTGVFIVVAVGAMSVLQLVNAVQAKTVRWESYKQGVLLHGAVFFLTLLSLLFIATQGALFKLAFWRGWLGGLLDSGGGLGYGSIPFVLTGFGGLLLFCLLMFLYMTPVIRAGHRALSGTLSARETFLALVGIYGLELMLTFVSQSRETDALQKYMHPAIILVLSYYAYGWRMKRLDFLPSRRFLLDGVALGLPLVLAIYAAMSISGDKGLLPLQDNLWESQHVHRAGNTYSPKAKLELRSLTELNQQGMDDLVPLFDTVMDSTSQGKEASIAVLSLLDGTLYLATGARPCLDQPYLYSILTTEGREAVLTEILDEQPVLVVLQVGVLPQLTDSLLGALEDSSRYFQENLGRRYRLKERIVSHEVWELKPAESIEK